MFNTTPHIPVLIDEVLRILQPKENAIYIDATFGNGGYSFPLLNDFNAKVIAFDRDEHVIPRTIEFKKLFKDRFSFFLDTFSNILPTMIENNIPQVDGLMLDIGISSMQIDNPERGFSFRFDAPLSMAMGKNTLNAYDVVNEFDEEKLADIFFNFGELSNSKKLAKIIIDHRKHKPIITTFDLVDLIKSIFGDWASQKIIPKVFQAIRIYVNDELGQLSKILNDSYNILKPGGKCIVVDFHSLEDRLVKNFIRENTKIPSSSRYLPDIDKNKKTLFKNLSKSVIIPSDLEIKNNPRSRSAKLRGFQKI